MTRNQILNYGHYMTVGHGCTSIALFLGCQEKSEGLKKYIIHARRPLFPEIEERSATAQFRGSVLDRAWFDDPCTKRNQSAPSDRTDKEDRRKASRCETCIQPDQRRVETIQPSEDGDEKSQ